MYTAFEAEEVRQEVIDRLVESYNRKFPAMGKVRVREAIEDFVSVLDEMEYAIVPVKRYM